MGLQQSAFNFDFVPEEKPVKKDDDVSTVDKVEKVDTVNKVDEGEKADDVYKKNIEIEAAEIRIVDEIEKVDDQIREIEFKVEENAEKLERLKKSQVKKSTRGRMKLSDMNAVSDLIEVPEDEVLFQKRYYSIGAVSEMFKVNVSLIRFWENEFDILKPKKNGKGDRLFRPEDVKNLKMIYHLLRDRKYTIEGAKEFLKKNKKAEENFAVIEGLKKLKLFLNEMKANF
ncbi:MAG: MerR family transcriptional regulator [Ferruginibacter sp.]